MIKNITYAAVFSFLLMPLIVVAQDEDATAGEIEDPLDQIVPVADEDTSQDAATEIDVATEEALLDEFSRYRKLILEGAFDEADIAAKRIVEMAITVYGPWSRETASALNNLGIVQHSNGQFDAAIQNFSSSIEIIEIAEDRLHDALVNPLKGLGAAQLSNNRPDQARKTFNRAAHITHVNEGPHNVGQVEILESIAESYIRMGDTKSARDILDRIHIINVKYFEKDPLGLLPSLMTRADWQHRAGFYAEERTTYRRAIKIIESSSGKKDPMLVEPLRRLGRSFYFVDVSMAAPKNQRMISTGEMYFKRAARIAEKSEDMDWHESTKTRLALADYYTYVDSYSRSRKMYRETWEFLSADEERVAFRDELFSDPVPIRADALPPFAGKNTGGLSKADNILTGKIVVDYKVSLRGRVRNLRTEATPPEFTDMQRMVHREIRRRIFRPRIEDGAPVEAEDMVFEHTFSYLQSDLDALREEQSESQNKKPSS